MDAQEEAAAATTATKPDGEEGAISSDDDEDVFGERAAVMILAQHKQDKQQKYTGKIADLWENRHSNLIKVNYRDLNTILI